MATYGSKPPRYGTVTSALSGFSGPAAYANAQPKSMPRPPAYGGAAGTSPSAFFGGNPFGLGGGAAPVTVAPPIKPAARPTPYTAPSAGPSQQQPPPQALAQPPDTSVPGIAYDYNTDPILQQITALSTQQRGDAQSGALSLRKQLAIDYGDTEYAQNVLGDAATAQAASANPNSVRAQLLKSYQTGQGTLDENLNKANLFYGGERIKQQGNLTQNYQSQLAGATGNEQGALGNIQSNLTSALSAADARDQAAQAQAAQAAQQAAMQQAMQQQLVQQQQDYQQQLLAALAAQYAQPSYDYGGGGGGGYDTGYSSPAPIPVAPAQTPRQALAASVVGLNTGSPQGARSAPAAPKPVVQTRQQLRRTPLAQLL